MDSSSPSVPGQRPRRRSLRGALAIVILGVGIAALGCAAPADEAPAVAAVPSAPPNVLLLIIDCMRADRLGLHRHGQSVTPNLDAIAGESVRFTRVFSQASWTRPSLPSILTGLYPSETGILGFDEEEGRTKGAALAPEVVTVAESLQTAGYATAMIGEQYQLAPPFALDQGFELRVHRGGAAGKIHRRFGTWLDEIGGKKPFFGYLHYLEAHWPYCGMKDLAGTFDRGTTSTLKPCQDWRKLRDDLRDGTVKLKADDIELLRSRYDEELLALDRDLGVLFADLKRRGLWEKTLVVVTADHGEEFAEHGGYSHARSLHDELLSVPLLIKPPADWPGPRGIEVDRLTELRSLAPTLREAAHAVAPSHPQAASLMPWITSGEPPGEGEPWIVAESSLQVALRTANRKLIVSRDGGKRVIYDLASDPGELAPLTGDDQAEVAALRSWRSALQPIAPRLPDDMDPELVKGLQALGYLE